jgi:hypothetical protein
MRRRALRPPAASLRLAGVRAVRSPPRPTPGRQAKPGTGPRERGRWRDVRRAAPGYGGATAPSTDRWRGEPGPCAGVRSTLASACPNLQQDTLHGTKAGLQDFRAERDATSRAGASCVPTAWSWPRRAGVRLARTHAIKQRLTKKNHGSTAGRSEPRARRVASLWHGGASRVSPRPSTMGCGVTPAPGVLVHWLGVAAARRPLCSTFHNLEITSLFARRRRRSRARTAQEPHPSRHGSSAARRPAPKQEINSDASHHLGNHHRKESKEEKRVEWPRCSRWGDGVVVAGLSVAWRRCSGR